MTLSVLEIIYEAVDQVNKVATIESRVEKQPSTVLLGEKGGLDSLGMVSFIIAVEEGLEAEYDVQISLVEGTSLTDNDSHLQTIGALNVHIRRIVDEMRGRVGGQG